MKDLSYLNLLKEQGLEGNKAWVTIDMAQAESLWFGRRLRFHGKREGLTIML
jgi:hypothetical protein